MADMAVVADSELGEMAMSRRRPRKDTLWIVLGALLALAAIGGIIAVVIVGEYNKSASSKKSAENPSQDEGDQQPSTGHKRPAMRPIEELSDDDGVARGATNLEDFLSPAELQQVKDGDPAVAPALLEAYKQSRPRGVPSHGPWNDRTFMQNKQLLADYVEQSIQGAARGSQLDEDVLGDLWSYLVDSEQFVMDGIRHSMTRPPLQSMVRMLIDPMSLVGEDVPYDPIAREDQDHPGQAAGLQVQLQLAARPILEQLRLENQLAPIVNTTDGEKAVLEAIRLTMRFLHYFGYIDRVADGGDTLGGLMADFVRLGSFTSTFYHLCVDSLCVPPWLTMVLSRSYGAMADDALDQLVLERCRRNAELGPVLTRTLELYFRFYIQAGLNRRRTDRLGRQNGH